MERVHVLIEAWIYPLVAFALLASAASSLVALIDFSAGEANYSTLAFGVGGIAGLMFTIWFWRNWKRPKVAPEPVPERSAVQVAADAAEAEADDFERAFMLSSADPFRSIVNDAWGKLYKLLTSDGSAGEIRAARINLAYYWRRWKENAPVQVEKGRTRYSEKYGVVEDPPSAG